MGDIYKKLLKVQLFLKAPKSRYNKFGKFYYRKCEDIFEAAKPILYDENLLLIVDDEAVMIGDRYYIKATATIIDCESSEKVSASAIAREEDKKGMDSAQVSGSTSSYARKLALNGLFCIDDSTDPDDPKNEGGSHTQKSDTSQNDAIMRVKEVEAELIRTGFSMKALSRTMEKQYKETDVSNLSSLQYKDLISKIKKLPDKANTETVLEDKCTQL